MAQRRMFSKEITNSSDFQMMSPSAQALYFHIGMNADDDGFCEVFTIVRMTESKPDDLRALHERGLVYLIDSKVGIVKDWHTNNDIRTDRYTRSKYLDDNHYGDIYRTIMQEKISHLSRYKDDSIGITSGSTNGTTQDRLGEVSIGKVSTDYKYGEFSNVIISDEELLKLNERFGEKNTQLLIEELSTYLKQKNKKYASHYATILSWGRRRVNEHQEKLSNKRQIV